MQIGRVTTPHGRPMTLALVRGQLETADRDAGKAVNKWKVFNDVGEAKDVFGLQDRSITVLQALLSFYPNDELSDESGGLIVFPSNNQLSLRAHGIAGTTLRRHLSALVDAGLIERRDSPMASAMHIGAGEGRSKPPSASALRLCSPVRASWPAWHSSSLPNVFSSSARKRRCRSAAATFAS